MALAAHHAELSLSCSYQCALLSRATAAADADAAAVGGSLLQPEVQALMQDTVPEQQHEAEPDQQQEAAGSRSSAEAAAAAQRAARLAAADSRQQSSGAAAGGGKVPKWFKK
jgi:hypothetical protein